MPPKAVTFASFLPSHLRPAEQTSEPAQLQPGQPRPQRCRCEKPFDLCWRYPANIPNAVCKATWDRLLHPFLYKCREWTIVELRSLWPHTVQALNERLMKGRMERTLKEDLQDDLQVLVDLIQYSCKPHPRPPRAGMKTLIVQGRILAEAIAQDALFQVDPGDSATPRPDRDLVDLINRLKEQKPDSLLPPALHVLRTLGNTAVHLDRDSARLTDAEIGDAAAICCRMVVHVVDWYMQLCSNLHRHEETRDALAEPLLEAPAAPIPAPNVLLRPQVPVRDTAAVGNAPGGVADVSAPQNLPPPRSSGTFPLTESNTSGRQQEKQKGDLGGSGSSVGSGDGSRRPSLSGCGDGAVRLPSGRVPSDIVTASESKSNGAIGTGGNGPLGVQARGQRGWWPPAGPLPSTVPTTLLYRTDFNGQGPGLNLAGLEAPVRPQESLQPLTSQPAATPSWMQGNTTPYGVLGSALSPIAVVPPATADDTQAGRWLSSGGSGGGSGGGSSYGAVERIMTFPTAAAPSPSQVPLTRMLGQPPQPPPSSASSSISQWVPDTVATFHPLQYTKMPCISLSSSLFTASSTVSANASFAAPLSKSTASDANRLTESLAATAAGNGASAQGMAPSAHSTLLSMSPLSLQLQQPYQQAGMMPQQQSDPNHNSQSQQHLSPTQPQSQKETGADSVAQGPAGGGSGTVAAATMNPKEASKRLLQLCASTQTPPAAKVEKLLQAGASLAFSDKSGMTALHLVSYWCHAEAAALLLVWEPSVTAATDRQGRTPLWVAAQRGHVEIVELLLGTTEGAMQVDVANAAGVTPLRVASAQGHHAVVALLLRAGASPERADKEGFTPLYVAAARSQLEVVRLLLGASTCVDQSDKAQRTPLWAALHPGGAAKAESCPERRAAVVRTLLSAGADVHLLPDGRDREYCWQLLAQSIAAGE